MLILFQALNAPLTKTPTNALKDKQKQTVQELADKVKTLLEETQPDGPQFTQTILDIISRENNWIMWKRDGCKPFERLLAPSQAPVVRNTGLRRKISDKMRMGNAELSRLWNLGANNHEFLTLDSRSHTPSVEEYLKPVEDGTYKQLENSKLYTWKALRLVARNRLRYFGELYNSSISIEELAKILEKEKNGGGASSSGDAVGDAAKGKGESGAAGVDESSQDADADIDMKDTENSQEDGALVDAVVVKEEDASTVISPSVVSPITPSTSTPTTHTTASISAATPSTPTTPTPSVAGIKVETPDDTTTPAPTTTITPATTTTPTPTATAATATPTSDSTTDDSTTDDPPAKRLKAE